MRFASSLCLAYTFIFDQAHIDHLWLAWACRRHPHRHHLQVKVRVILPILPIIIPTPNHHHHRASCAFSY